MGCSLQLVVGDSFVWRLSFQFAGWKLRGIARDDPEALGTKTDCGTYDTYWGCGVDGCPNERSADAECFRPPQRDQ